MACSLHRGANVPAGERRRFRGDDPNMALSAYWRKVPNDIAGRQMASLYDRDGRTGEDDRRTTTDDNGRTTDDPHVTGR